MNNDNQNEFCTARDHRLMMGEKLNEYWVARDGRLVEKPTFYKFFTHDELMELVENAETRCRWDANSSLGETVGEKFESLYVKMMELNEALIERGAAGVFWIATSPETASIFEIRSIGFCPSDHRTDKFDFMAQGIRRIKYKGEINDRWRLYTNSEFPENLILMGVNDTREDNAYYGVIEVENLAV